MSIHIWSGNSLLDPSARISVYLTGLRRASKNAKTGPMLQTWILRDDMSPIEARKNGADRAICGDCPHRAGSCYVNLAHAPSAIYKHRPPSVAIPNLYGHVRLGAYGDPAAIPFEVWTRLLANALDWTGYTHQWRTCDQRLKRFCMASVDSLEERNEAHDLGWRTFRVGAEDEAPVEREVLCPASEHAGKKLQCITCLHCNGLSTGGCGDVFIPVHGSTNVLRAYVNLGIISGRATASVPKGALKAEDRSRIAAQISKSADRRTHSSGGHSGTQDKEAAQEVSA